MKIAFTIAIILLSQFSLLGLYDGFYLHIFKYKLYEHDESRKEHIMHTIRAILFPAILYFLYLKNNCTTSFYIGIALVLLDIITLGIDAFIEKDSRFFMGGLPRWEYITHLFINGFHFASIAVFLIIKINIDNDALYIRNDFSYISNYNTFTWLVTNLIPGAILLSLLHVIVLFPCTSKYLKKIRNIITCC